MDRKTTTAGLLFPLLDWHGDRLAGDVPVELRGQVRALYAATEVFVHLELASAHGGGRWRAVIVAAVRVAWIAGVLAGRASVIAPPETQRRPVRPAD